MAFDNTASFHNKTPPGEGYSELYTSQNEHMDAFITGAHAQKPPMIKVESSRVESKSPGDKSLNGLSTVMNLNRPSTTHSQKRHFDFYSSQGHSAQKPSFIKEEDQEES